MKYLHKYLSNLGEITLASDGKALTGLWFDGQKYYGAGLQTDYEEKRLPVFDETIQWLERYFEGEALNFMPDMSLKGSPFRLAVWEVMKEIPYGHTMSYGQIAEIVAKRLGLAHMSAQAVGGAVAHNPISIIIPCHRVVGTNGSLTGYAGGIDRKISLLTLERADMKGLFVPKRGTAL